MFIYRIFLFKIREYHAGRRQENLVALIYVQRETNLFERIVLSGNVHIALETLLSSGHSKRHILCNDANGVSISVGMQMKQLHECCKLFYNDRGRFLRFYPHFLDRLKG